MSSANILIFEKKKKPEIIGKKLLLLIFLIGLISGRQVQRVSTRFDNMVMMFMLESWPSG